MKIGAIDSGLIGLQDIFKSKKTETETPFGDVLGDFVREVNTDQKQAGQMTNDFVNGKGVELHEVMIAGEKAKTSLDLLMEIRNKSLDMYKEITRMQ